MSSFLNHFGKLILKGIITSKSKEIIKIISRVSSYNKKENQTKTNSHKLHSKTKRNSKMLCHEDFETSET